MQPKTPLPHSECKSDTTYCISHFQLRTHYTYHTPAPRANRNLEETLTDRVLFHRRHHPICTLMFFLQKFLNPLLLRIINTFSLRRIQRLCDGTRHPD